MMCVNRERLKLMIADNEIMSILIWLLFVTDQRSLLRRLCEFQGTPNLICIFFGNYILPARGRQEFSKLLLSGWDSDPPSIPLLFYFIATCLVLLLLHTSPNH